MTTIHWILGLSCLFISSDAAEISGSVLWDSTNGRFLMQDTSSESTSMLATGTFSNNINSTGWGILDIQTNSLNNFYLDYHQAYAAGLLEGRMTKDLIKTQFSNEYSDYCSNHTKYCDDLANFLQKNLDFMLEMGQTYGLTDPFWHHVNLALIQLAGIESGIKMLDHYVYVGENLKPNVSAVMLLSLHGDLFDLENVLGKEKAFAPGAFSSCSGLIKVTDSFKDILVGHATWTGYNTMLRIQKRFKFQFHNTLDSTELVPGNNVAFSSYPGRLISGDDFYVLSSGLLVSETTIENNNPDLYDFTTVKTVPSWIRNIVANRLANTGKEWADLYKKFNSGTYNNQWMVVDYKKFKPGQPIQNGTFHVLEQMPGYVVDDDLSWFLNKYGYWPSYNVAYFPDIFSLSAQWDLVKKYGDWFTYDKTPRALIFKRDQATVTDLPTLRKLLRYNNFKKDPLSRCNCTPPYSAENAISSRCDLNPKNGTYPFAALGYRPRGGTDVKVINSTMVSKLQMLIQSGPTNDNQPTFVWSKSDYNDIIKHAGHPDVFDFDPILAAWSD